ncbi:YaiI/YqxD family protein [Metabacillus arenae]|uniref:UPF0178 protein IC621_17950 n=1 Tax=Metabacillus arenae TaxID=2771434 RepID=A0A926ND86_9BACI|nr:YaiI/YqxD family protein [Metabacillus arenae]MBD1382117.1 YaiI/YqxD family protein [Metabacillus arenae]
MKIFVDADACPVKDEIVKCAQDFQLKVTFVASYNHKTSRDQAEHWVYVDAGKEAADLYIVNHVSSGDFVISQDIGLAGLLLQKQVNVITPRGKVYNEENIDTALQFRYLSAQERRSGNYLKGPKPYTKEDRLHFLSAFKKILSKNAGDKR